MTSGTRTATIVVGLVLMAADCAAAVPHLQELAERGLVRLSGHQGESVAWAAAEVLERGVPADWSVEEPLVGQSAAKRRENQSRLRRGLPAICGETADPLDVADIPGRQSLIKVLAERRPTLFVGRVAARQAGWSFGDGWAADRTVFEVERVLYSDPSAPEGPGALAAGARIEGWIPYGGRMGDGALCSERPSAIEDAQVGDRVVAAGFQGAEKGVWRPIALFVIREGRIGPIEHPQLLEESWAVGDLADAIGSWKSDDVLPAGTVERILWTDRERTAVSWLPADLVDALPLAALPIRNARQLLLSLSYASQGIDPYTRAPASCFSRGGLLATDGPPPRLLQHLADLADDPPILLIGIMENAELGWSLHGHAATLFQVRAERSLGSEVLPSSPNFRVLNAQNGGEFVAQGVKLCTKPDRWRPPVKVGDRVLVLARPLPGAADTLQAFAMLPIADGEILESVDPKIYIKFDELERALGRIANDQLTSKRHPPQMATAPALHPDRR
jgi:hypothetical protein